MVSLTLYLNGGGGFALYGRGNHQEALSARRAIRLHHLADGEVDASARWNIPNRPIKFWIRSAASPQSQLADESG